MIYAFFCAVNIIEDIKMFVKISLYKIRLKLSKFEQKRTKAIFDYELKNYTTKIRFTIKMPQFLKDQRLSSSQKATVMLRGTPCNSGYMI